MQHVPLPVSMCAIKKINCTLNLINLWDFYIIETKQVCLMGKCKTWTVDSGLDSWTGLWTEIWTRFWTDAQGNDDHFQQ